MLFRKINRPASGNAFRDLKWAALLCSSLMLASVPGAYYAAASDLDIVDGVAEQGIAENDSNFLRIGVNKSVVVRLPGDAQDLVVGDPAVVDAVIRSKNTAYLFARTVGQTNLFFFDKNGRQLLNLEIEVAVDVTALQNILKRTIPGTKIKADTINGSVVLSGTAPNAAEAALAVQIADEFITKGVTGVASSRTINNVKILGEDQVMLKVRIVEVQRNVLKQFGVDLQAMVQFGNLAIGLQSLSPLGTGGSNFLGGNYTSGSNFAEGIIRAMESDGVLKTLAEPNLTAVSGKAAKFHAGGEVPVQTCTGAGASQTCSVEYRDFGVSLSFTPVVLSEGRINLTINTDVSDLGTELNGNPTFDSRSAETVIELPSGGSMMLAGLIKDTTRQSIEGIPGLKKLPVLGALFRSRDFTQNQTELVVIVTPYLVGSVAERQLATPADHFNNPTDRQTILLGRLNKIYGTPGNNPDGVYHGNVGFIVE
jgi:pilus assembly protein CpaC